MIVQKHDLHQQKQMRGVANMKYEKQKDIFLICIHIDNSIHSVIERPTTTCAGHDGPIFR